ncbi:MAG: hypothetical protein COY09_00165 [Candidatus Portnoybacteria bacterium CG_4_10_14_0_2_um_filter_39_11]|uniref:Ribbon-helix-helix protein CopG domain-containing protein n=1 Tax=Candidatus Portnoybacteria bacterium CG_4_10_14_0_2_um_filter_39_11 TaxID=1974797 RepID=A0A2M7UKF9_9BACT|nr:MAG: hypothetical protein AUJ33_02905 [Parcubacteria group bacterium CG1_02_40_25]PIZ71718.1 MAG: hypothetical protein COY09_00165 [Candidatus Portnoybacteria bacterium CG_4_10_14_0_2_um_filter_39_11]
MRQIINISITQDLAKSVEQLMQSDGYATKSELFRDLLRMRLGKGIYQELQASRQELAIGKGKVLRTLKDLR